MAFQSCFMSTTVQPRCTDLVPRLVELADVRGPVVGPLPLDIGVMHDPRQARAVAGGRVLQHLMIAVRVAEREDRPASNETVDADRDLPERPTGKPIARRGN